ncbi:response regulator transcription factor [Massilia rhizosphaerae]|uniref:response regulator transcription factor n=1 Tax=Massilia rhizosphaerae TaxID=2784389 RepID=UPI0018DD1344|nr:DNA-binding response regulator [Massilia rhizosphaerae]
MHSVAYGRTQGKPTVLIVDDEVINIKMIADVLADECEVLFACSAAEALQLAQAQTPDVILLDVVMPDLDGYTVCARLKSDPATADIPVIFITSLDAVEQEVKGFEAGAIDYVTKPLRLSAVKARVQKHIGYRRAQTAASGMQTTPEPDLAALSARQKEIFAWVQAGKTNWEIARIIGCSEDNVKYHMKKIMRVFDVSNRTLVAALHPRIDPRGIV